MDDRGLSSVKTHKRKCKNLVDPGDLVSEKSLQKSYKILGQVIYKVLHLHTGIQGVPKKRVKQFKVICLTLYVELR